MRISDWISDVCSSDLTVGAMEQVDPRRARGRAVGYVFGDDSGRLLVELRGAPRVGRLRLVDEPVVVALHAGRHVAMPLAGVRIVPPVGRAQAGAVAFARGQALRILRPRRFTCGEIDRRKRGAVVQLTCLLW